MIFGGFLLVASGFLLISGALPIKGLYQSPSPFSRVAGVFLLFGYLGKWFGMGGIFGAIGSMFGSEYYGRAVFLIFGLILIVVGMIHGLSKHKIG